MRASTRGDDHIGLDIDEQASLTTHGNSAAGENPRALQTTIEISAVYVYDGDCNRLIGLDYCNQSV